MESDVETQEECSLTSGRSRSDILLSREEREIEQLIDKEPLRTGPRHSTPDISNIFLKATASNKMLAFNLPEARKREVHEYLEECALRAKVKLMVAHMREMALVEEEEEEEVREPTPAPEYELMLKNFADVQPPPLAQTCIDNIVRMLPPRLVHNHSALVKKIIEEVKVEYQANLHRLSVCMKFAPFNNEKRMTLLTPLKHDIGGKTKNYGLFLKCKKIIENELFLTHPLIRKILNSSKLAIPEVLVNFKNYRKRGWLHLDKLVSLIQSDMKKEEHQICKNWYPKLINLISVRNSLETVPRDLWSRFVKCASTVVSVQITQLMQRTITHIIDTLSDVNTFPQISLDAYYAGSTIALIPSEDEIFTSFHRIIDTISYMAQDMPAMEAWFSVPCPNKFIVVKRSESFVRTSHETLEHNLYQLFTPIRDYLKVLGDDFSGLCSDKQFSDIQKFLRDDHTYEEMFDKVSYIKDYSKKVKTMVSKEYFPVIRLSQGDVISHLTKVSNGFMQQILQEISKRQINENKKIRGEFELVAERTLHMPVKTKELVAMGSYIKHCRTAFMDKTKARILSSIQLALRLMDFINLTPQHLLLNATIVNWLKKITPIFEEYSDLFENTKYELEERLQRTTEKLNKELEDVGPSLSSLSNMDDVNKITEYVQFIQKFLRRLEQFDSKVSWINNEEVLFKFPISTYPELDELKSIVHPFAKLIFTCNKWFRTYKIWMDGAFDELVLEAVEEQVKFFFLDLTSTQKLYKTKCKQQATDNYPRRFKGVVDDPDVNNWPAPLKLSSQTINHINEFKRHLRLIGIVCNSALRQRHWRHLSEIAGFNVTPDAGTTLRKFIGNNLDHLLDQFEVISISACQELQLYQTLCAMKDEWLDVLFTSVPYQDTTINILSEVDDILTLVDNHLMKCVAVKGSAFIIPLKEKVKDWCEKLDQVNLTIETWQEVEKQWLDFYPIFTCDKIRCHMEAEVLLFQEVDGMYQDLMKEVSHGAMSVIKTAGEPELYNSLVVMSNILEKINIGVKIYLNKLQLYFPRLFFLSNVEILSMLAETKLLDIIDEQLRKIFMGIHKLCYDSGNNNVVAFKSAEEEMMTLENPIEIKKFSGCMEQLLAEIEKEMKISVKVQCKKCLNMYKRESFGEWVLRRAGQAVQCALLTIRTGQIHSCLVQRNLDQLQIVIKNIQIQRETLFNLVQLPQINRLRASLEALIILTVYTLDYLQLIKESHTLSDTDFNWIAQLRYYQEDIVTIRMLNATLPYGYEYMNNTSRLVVTPLTERCFRSLIGAYHMNLHGAPEGPPETGKTETVRDLAKAIAVYCFSFSCSAALSHSAIGKFLKGIAGCGAWGCLNDFNKIKLEVMSVVAQHLTTITTAVRTQACSFLFDGDKTSLNLHCYICVTLFRGLSVQSPIPENLKILFRPVAMMFPDTQIIAEVCLQSFGFTNSQELALKLVSLQTLCSKQFSDQSRFCYDFGSLKAVLKVTNSLKQSGKYVNEIDLILEAIKDTFYPKLSDDNIYVLNTILSDLFPGHVISTSRDSSQLTSTISQICKDMLLKDEDVFVTKIVQICEALKVNMGIILIGDPISGKTSALKVVRKLLGIDEEMNEETATGPINPKTLSLSQLFGYTNSGSKEWIDGMVPQFFRTSNKNRRDKEWLVLDGPMDSSWMDVLNTAFDTMQRLCLSSGEIIPISQNVSIIFETMVLNQASPATVSRCGVIFCPPHTVGWRGLVHSWRGSKLDPQKTYNTLFNWIVPPTLTFVETKCTTVMKAGCYNMVKTMLLLIEMMLKDAIDDNDDYHKHIPVWVQSATLLAGVWAFGGALTQQSRLQFDVFFRDIWRGNIEEHPMPESIEKLEINIPSEGQLNDYWYHFKGKGAWRFWPEVVRSLKIEEDVPNLQFTMVSTIESAKYLNILEMHVKHFSPLLFVGPTATGKSFYINKVISKLALEKYLPITISFTPNTTAHFFQDYTIKKLQRKSKLTYRGAAGRSTILFVDDVNMTTADKVEAQPPQEVLRHFLDHSQWVRTKNNTLVRIEDMLLLSACGVPGGHRTHICPRVLRHFSFFALSSLSDESVSKIYSTLLFTGFKRNGFATDVMPTVLCIIAATTELLQWLSENLPPTPIKPHYAFSLRDFAKLIYSHLLVKRENVDNKKVFIRLWVHEALRVVSDRLIEPGDRSKLTHQLRLTVKECFKECFDTSFDNLMPKGQEQINEDNLRNLVFTTALNSENIEEKKYEEVGSLDQLLIGLTAIIETHNSSQPDKINIVLFRFAVEHLSRLCRVLTISRGSCVLLGLRGSGRQTISQLAAILTHTKFYQPSIVYNYGLSEWRTDLKRVLLEAGGRDTRSVFFVSENELKNDLFLQDVDLLLSTGQVPGMFTEQETETIYDMVRLSAQGGNRNMDINPLTVYGFFVDRCQHNLHIILSLSSVSYSFRKWITLYPSLLNYCTINWVEPYKTMMFKGKEYKLNDWPEEALEKIAFHYWDGLDIARPIMGSAVNLCKYIHVTARDAAETFQRVCGRKCYVTSASYLTMVKKYRCLVEQKQQDILSLKAKFICGLEKIDFADKQVCVMQKELEALLPQLQVASEETERMKEVIERETVTIDKASGLVREDEKVAKTQAAAANNLKTECEADLALAIPILEEAVAALNTLKPTDITLVKSMKNPPDTVKLVMAAVCVMKDIKPEKIPDPNTPGRKILDYWGPSKRLLGDMAFLQQLKDYDKDNIPASIMIMIRKQYLPNKDFKPHIVAKASSAAEGLCKWVIAMDMYDAVAKEVAPKKVKLEIAEQEFAATMAILEEKRAQVRMLEEKLMDLNAKLDAAQQRKQVLENEVRRCENKLWKAQRLIGGLGGEKQRWFDTASNLQTNYDNLPGDMLISCGIIAYVAPLTSQFRETLIEEWCKTCIELNIPTSEDFNFIKVLGYETNIHNWNIYGLPRDDFSILNAVILENTYRCPLLIDPQGHANQWIKAKEQPNGLVVVQLSDEDYMKVIETTLTQGNPVLLENVERDLKEIILSPFLVKRDLSNGSPRIYITTKLKNPLFSPPVFNNFTVINFTLTLNGLENKLLDILVAKERPDLQEKKEAMIIANSENKIKLKHIEKRILEILSYTKGNILENETAIDILDKAKIESVKIQEEQKEVLMVEEELHNYCQEYYPVAEHSARLYFCLTDLSNINYMYQFSLKWFLKLYIISIETANKSKKMEVRLKYMKEKITYNLFRNVCCSLYEKHRILFSLLLCTAIELGSKQIQEDELNVLMNGKYDLVESNANNPASEWLEDSAWKKICYLNQLPNFNGLTESFIMNNSDWKDLQKNNGSPFPSPWDNKLCSFQKLILIKIIYPEQMTSSITGYVAECMGPQYAKLPSFDINSSFEDSNCQTPLLFIVTPGTDPVTNLRQFARKKQFQNRLHTISLGIEQDEEADQLVKVCREEGSWVCLQNCQLAGRYLGTLERLCDSINLHNTSMEFRLWLTSTPTTEFPVSILQNSVKMTTDLSSGLKSTLMNSFLSEPIVNEEFFYGCPGKDRAFAKLIFSLSFLHAAVQERKRFGYMGWNAPYEFTQVDFHISLQQLQMYINESKEIPYNIIQFMVGECNYGGRMHDIWDQRLLNTLVSDMINTQVTETPNYQLSPISDKFQVPLRFEYHDFLVAIKELPDCGSDAQVFGLDQNADLLHNLQVGRELIETLQLLQPDTTPTNQPLQQSTLTTVSTILNKLPEALPMVQVPSSSVGVQLVLQQECKLYNNLLHTICSSLQTLRGTFLGTIEMSENFEREGSQIEKNKVPSSWLKMSYVTCKSLGSFIDDLAKRVSYLKSVMSEGLGQEVWLPGLYRPQALLVAALYQHSRLTRIPFHLITFDHLLMSPTTTSDQAGIIITGLYIQGATCHPSRCALEEQPQRTFFSSVPKIWFKPQLKTEMATDKRYHCAVYSTEARSEFVTEVFLPTDRPPAHWLYKGVVLLCQVDI